MISELKTVIRKSSIHEQKLIVAYLKKMSKNNGVPDIINLIFVIESVKYN